MNSSKNILIAIDQTEASMRAVGYVATMIDGRSGFHVRLLHVLPSLPSELLEIPWTDTPQLAERAQAEFRDARARWIAKAQHAAQPLFDEAKVILRDAGVSDQAVHTQCLDSFDIQEVAADILEAAHTQQCGTIVVGRHALSGLQEMLHRHVGDQLVRKGQGLAVWIVE